MENKLLWQEKNKSREYYDYLGEKLKDFSDARRRKHDLHFILNGHVAVCDV